MDDAAWGATIDDEEPDALAALKDAIEARKRNLPGNREWCRRGRMHKDVADAADVRSHANNWALSHKKRVFKAPLPQALEQRIRLWFQSLDRSSSGALSKDEMAAAMDMGGIPSDRVAVDKLVSMMDLDDSGSVDLHEFEVFIREQVARGHLIDDCALLLPSGETLTLSQMVTNQTRRNLVQDMIRGGGNRARWTDEDGEKALEAINAQRAVTEIVKHHRQQTSATGSKLKDKEGQLQSKPCNEVAVARLAAAEAAKTGYTQREYRNRRRQFRKMLKTCKGASAHVPSRKGTRNGDTAAVHEACNLVLDDTPLPSAAITTEGRNSFAYNNDGTSLLNLRSAEEVSHFDRMIDILRIRSPQLLPIQNRPYASMVQTPRVQFPRFVGINFQRTPTGSSCQSGGPKPGLYSARSSFRSTHRGSMNGASSALQHCPSMVKRRSVGNIIHTLHERVKEDEEGKHVRDLTFRWNKPFQMAPAQSEDSVWHEVGAFTTGVPPKANETLRDGGICATPDLPHMDKQCLVFNRQRLKQTSPEVANKKHEYIRRRNWGIRPDWLVAPSVTDEDSGSVDIS